MKPTIIVLALPLVLGACSIADHFQARDRMEKSHDAYRRCVGDNLSDPAKCDPLKAIYEQDKAAYDKT